MALLISKTIQREMMILLVNDKLEEIWKEAVGA
jgi:hypothetical protein